MSNIEWTQETWNPIAGCSKVSAGCANCYAEVMAGRLERMGQAKYQGLTVLQGKHARWTGKIAFDEDALLAPLRRKKPTIYRRGILGVIRPIASSRSMNQFPRCLAVIDLVLSSQY